MINPDSAGEWFEVHRAMAGAVGPAVAKVDPPRGGIGGLSMPVYWTIQARRHLRQALAEALSGEVVDESRVGKLERPVTQLDDMLRYACGARMDGYRKLIDSV